MARIRHIALATRDPEATKRFYIEGLGLKEVGKVNSPDIRGLLPERWPCKSRYP
jgi:catechol 2,3-dioxygenase-like lactoylglutathione lyase family enzyme